MRRKKIKESIDYNPIIKYVREIFSHIPSHKILVDNLETDATGKFDQIFLNIPFLIRKQNKLKDAILDKLTSYDTILSEEGFIFLNCPFFVLESSIFMEFRERVLKKYKILGLISFHTSGEIKTSGALIILSRYRKRATLASITTNEQELKASISIILKATGETTSLLFEVDEVLKESFNPQFYHPKYIKLQEELDQYDTTTLGEVAEIIYGVHYRLVDLRNEGKWRFLRPREIKQDQITEITKESRFFQEFKGKKEQQLQLYDIIISNVFPSKKIAITFEEDTNVLPSHDFYVIRCRKISPQYLFAFLKSKAGKDLIFTQIEQKSRGFQKRISIPDLDRVRIPIFSDYMMEKIGKLTSLKAEELVEVSEELKLQSSSLKEEKGMINNIINQLIKLGWDRDSILQEYRIKKGKLSYSFDICLRFKEESMIGIEIKRNVKKTDAEALIQNIKQIDSPSIPYLVLINSQYEYLFIDVKKNKISLIEELPGPDIFK